MFGRFVRRKATKAVALQNKEDFTKQKEKKRKEKQHNQNSWDEMYLRKRFRHMNWPLLFLQQQRLTDLQGRLLKGGHRCPYGFPSGAPTCLPARERQLRKKRAPKGSSSSSKTNLQTGYESARQRIVNVLTCASSHCNHKLNKPVFGRLLPSPFF